MYNAIVDDLKHKSDKINIVRCHRPKKKSKSFVNKEANARLFKKKVKKLKMLCWTIICGILKEISP